MANGATRLSQAKMLVQSNKPGTAESDMEMDVYKNEPTGSIPKKMKKISLKNPSEHNHSV
jgi:hypothetical protein